MQHTENWIWLPKDKYTNAQNTVCSGFQKRKAKNYTVAEFQKTYKFPKKVVQADLIFSADSVFQLFCNDCIVATGPACVGGDFIGNEKPRDNFYSFEHTIYPDAVELNFFARVQMLPYHICEYSKGHGGFMLSALLTFEDGSKIAVCTDESWMVRKNGAYSGPKCFDGRITPDEFLSAENTPNIWNTTTAPIPVRQEREITPDNGIIHLLPFEEKTVVLEFDKIWGGFIKVEADTQGELYAEVMCRELSERTSPERLTFTRNQTYRGFSMHSAGNIEVTAKNLSAHQATLKVSFIETHYPIYEEANSTTSDPELNAVLQTCKHTLKICRQTHHLDSPRHCEPLACTGDYYIESLMTPFSFGDMRLAEFDMLRTAIMLERENGRMFHTTYSLIWVKMLWDVYMITGNGNLLKDCEKALSLLLSRFETYIGENGLIETPPDYMFVDWIYIDEISLHHPPKALGQSCMNMFYFGALESAANIYLAIGNQRTAEDFRIKKEALRIAINRLLFDDDKGCYFEGLNTPTPPELIGNFMPQNIEKRYYLKHANILAAYFGVCDDDTSKKLIHKVMAEEIDGDCQPYFLHYLLDAVYRLGLREKYTLQICERWKAPVQQCTKGLVEGFVAPEPNYNFDHSHAWGGTPLYALPKAIMGLEIVEPGMKKITLSPSLLGLDYAKAELLTPYGKVICEAKIGEKISVTHPEDITVNSIS